MTTRSSTALVEATGRDYDDWFTALDAWGAADKASGDARAWLRDEHGASAWWAQKLVVEYEQLRGIRVPGSRPDGTSTTRPREPTGRRGSKHSTRSWHKGQVDADPPSAVLPADGQRQSDGDGTDTLNHTAKQSVSGAGRAQTSSRLIHPGHVLVVAVNEEHVGELHPDRLLDRAERDLGIGDQGARSRRQPAPAIGLEVPRRGSSELVSTPLAMSHTASARPWTASGAFIAR